MTDALSGAPSGDRLEIALPDDFHVHLRQVPEMPAYARRQALSFGRALVMPNTVPPVVSAADIVAYRAAILAAGRGDGAAPIPLMTFKLLPGMSAEAVRGCAAAGAIAGKYYPVGSTTNAADGPSDPSEVREAIAAMEEAGIALCVHAEDPDASVLDREAAFIPTLERLLAAHPRLKVVVEHVSSIAMLGFVLSAPARVAATLTAHHLLLRAGRSLGRGDEPPPLLQADPQAASGSRRVARGRPARRAQALLRKRFGAPSAGGQGRASSRRRDLFLAFRRRGPGRPFRLGGQDGRARGLPLAPRRRVLRPSASPWTAVARPARMGRAARSRRRRAHARGKDPVMDDVGEAKDALSATSSGPRSRSP